MSHASGLFGSDVRRTIGRLYHIYLTFLCLTCRLFAPLMKRNVRMRTIAASKSTSVQQTFST